VCICVCAFVVENQEEKRKEAKLFFRNETWPTLFRRFSSPIFSFFWRKQPLLWHVRARTNSVGSPVFRAAKALAVLIGRSFLMKRTREGNNNKIAVHSYFSRLLLFRVRFMRITKALKRNMSPFAVISSSSPFFCTSLPANILPPSSSHPGPQGQLTSLLSS